MFSELIYCKKIYQSKYLDVWLKFKNQIINWKDLTVESTNPNWESNPSHLFRCYTTRPLRSAYLLSIQLEWTDITLLKPYIWKPFTAELRTTFNQKMAYAVLKSISAMWW